MVVILKCCTGYCKLLPGEVAKKIYYGSHHFAVGGFAALLFLQNGGFELPTKKFPLQ